MDNKDKIDSLSGQENEIENSEEGVSDHPSSIFDDNTGEIDKRSFGSNSGRNSSKSIPEDYERMLKEQEDFLKSLDEQFSSYGNDNNSDNETSSLEELLKAYAEPVADDIVTAPELNIDPEKTAEFRIPEINIPDVTENPSVQEYEIPEIKIDDLLAETENKPETAIQVPEVNLDDVSYVEPDNDTVTPDLKIDLSDMNVPENLEDTIEIQTFLDDETREIINDLSNMEEPETYSELVVDDKPAEEPEYEEAPADQQQVEDPEYEEVHFDAPEYETYPEDEDVVVVKDNEYEGEDNPLAINGYEPAPYQESEPEEEYNPMFDELLKDEPVDETVDEFTETNVDEFVEEEVPEWEAFVEQFDSREEKPAVEENTEEPVLEESAEEPVVEEPAEYDPNRMPWEDMVETIDTASEELPYEEKLQQPAEEDYELPKIENDEAIDYSDLDIQMFKEEYEDEEETEEDFNDFDIDAYIQENLSHTSNLVFPKFDENGQPVVEETPVQEEPVETPEVMFEEPEIPAVEEPEETDDDDYDVETSIHETFANINAELPDFGKEFEEPAEEAPVQEAEVTVEDYKPEESAPVETEEEPVIEEVPVTEENIDIPEVEIEKAEIPEVEMPLEVDDDDYDVEASIRETFANINAELPDFGKEFEEKVDEIPVEEVETIVEDHNPETVEFAEEPVMETPAEEDYVDVPEIEIEPVNEDFNIEIEPVDLDFGNKEASVDLPEIEDISFENPEEPAVEEIQEVEIPETKVEEPEVPEIELPQEDDDDDYDVEASIHETFANINAELPDFGKEFEEPAEELKLDIPEEEPVVEEAKAPEFDFSVQEEKPAPEEHVVTGRTAELRGLTDLDMTFMFDDDDSVDNIDSIISEIKDYNIEKGIRNVEDTQINIISEIKKEELMARENEPEPEEAEEAPAKPAEKKSFLSSFFGVSEAEIDNYEEDEDEEEEEKPSENNSENTVDIPVEEYAEEEIEKTKSSIMKAIADMKPIEEGELLYDDEPVLDNEFESVYTAPQPEPQLQKQKTSSYEDQEHISVLTKQIEKERIAREEMFEQTQQLKLQVSEYENELNDVTNNMSRTNRILNVILTLLIIALFVILFIMGFFFAKERGLI
ncbi:MAG: hypothetical protein IJG59_07490 [Erysipelotrichaceae bacterium]|nr:hypothetical protein [Erysipelotrichaceae bacterium]